MARKALDKHRELGQPLKTSVKLDSAWRLYILSLTNGGALSNGLRNCVRKSYQLDLEKGTLPIEYLASYMHLHSELKADMRAYFITHAGRLPEEALKYDPNEFEAQLAEMDETDFSEWNSIK